MQKEINELKEQYEQKLREQKKERMYKSIRTGAVPVGTNSCKACGLFPLPAVAEVLRCMNCQDVTFCSSAHCEQHVLSHIANNPGHVILKVPQIADDPDVDRLRQQGKDNKQLITADVLPNLTVCNFCWSPTSPDCRCCLKKSVIKFAAPTFCVPQVAGLLSLQAAQP